MESHDKDEPLEIRLAQVCGQVQGVGYREACLRRASELGVAGKARNRMRASTSLT
ncbi:MULTISPECIES: acylphosphatase [unclassified Paraburkholderia]|uniref:acylphosphatase n=1 Tax=unclassified Paraburkholderia TaxID=2615204 RepID=UPI0038B8C4FD